MREIIFSKAGKKLLCLLVIIAVLFGISAFSGRSVLSSVINGISLPMQEVAAAGAADVNKKTYEQLQQENEQLNTEISQLRTQLADYYNVKQENLRLWRYYDLKQENPEYELLPSTVVRRDPNDDFYSFTVNKGTLAGVAVNDPVVTEKGLIGWVCSADLYTSRVKTVLSPEAKVGAIDVVSRDSGIVSGSVELADSNLTTLTKISAQNTLKQGDIVVTTGISGLYPAQLIVGEVRQVLIDEYDTTKYAVIAPFEDIRSVIDVVVITGFEGQGEVSDSSVEDAAPTQPATTAATTAAATGATTEARQ